MTRGRKPTAPHLKVLAGTNRPDREVKDAPQFDPVDEFPEPPQHLSSDGAEMWNKLGRQLMAARVLQVVDLYPLEQLCFMWQCFRRKAKANMEPTAAESNAMKAIFSEFGMTPASRSKVTSKADGKGASKFSKFKDGHES